MIYAGLLAPIAFVFAISALAQVGSLKKEVDNLKKELEALKKNETEDNPGFLRE